jgi:hypothetical protein
MRSSVLAAAGAAIIVSVASAHPYGWRIGATADDQLTVDFLWQMPHTRFATHPDFAGVIDTGLQFEEWPVPNPALGLFPLAAGSKIALEVVSFDTGVRLWDPLDLSSPYDAAGQLYAIGTSGSSFLRDAVWQIDPSAAGFDAGKGTWHATFRFVDRTGTYAASEDYTFLLKPAFVPAPAGAAALLGLGVLAGRRRR